MKRSVISSLALTAAMLLSTAAWAETTVGGQTVSDEDLPKVQAQCDTLAAVEGGSLVKEDSSSEATEPNGTDQATTTIDLSIITLEDCKTAGLVK